MNEQDLSKLTAQDVASWLYFYGSRMTSTERSTVAAAYNAGQNAAIRRTAGAFRVGERVYWEDKYGTRTVGTIRKVNKVTIICTADKTGAKWRVSPNLISRV